MKSDRRVPVAIVGGGFSGTILAAQLARRAIASALIDGSGRLGRGVAYSTTEPAHLLNVPADGMSAWAGDPDHFARRFAREGGIPGGFAERRLFGCYLGEILADAAATGHVETLASPVIATTRRDGCWQVELEDGSALEAEALAIAVGNQRPEPLQMFARAGDRFVADPWGPAAQAAVRDLAATGGNALLVGTGLTMVDLALSLDAAGYQERIVALSRRGQVPRAHGEFAPAPVEVEELPSGNLLGLWRWLRRRSKQVGWRAAIDSLRPHSHRLWQSLSRDEQRRFLRHARPYWDVHRHRIAPEVATTVAGMVGAGRLEVAAGRIERVERHGDELEVAIRKRGASNAASARFAYAFNCTGPLHAIDRSSDPLLRSLLDAGEVRPDHLGIGLDVDQRSRAGPTGRVWALGPLTKGRYWEIIAVPDIREQAAAIAEDIARELHG